ncbi:Fructose-like permease IIC component, partial [Frankliniella fusca]
MPSPCVRPGPRPITACTGSRGTSAGTLCAPRVLESGVAGRPTFSAGAARGCTASVRCAAAVPWRQSSATYRSPPVS